MNKKILSESDTCDKFIRPAMEIAGWDGMSQIYREYPLRAGRVVVRGRKARRHATTVLRADYALFFKTYVTLAVVEVTRVTELRCLCAHLHQRLERSSAAQAALADSLIDQALAA